MKDAERALADDANDHNFGWLCDVKQRLAAAHPQASGEARNLLGVARLLAAAALERRESRGGHYRSDYPVPSPAWQRRLFLTANADGSARFEPMEVTVPILAIAGGRS